MTLVEHLEELRTRLILSVAFLLLGMVVGFILAKPVTHWLIKPFGSIQIERKEKLLRLRFGKNGTLGLADPSETEQLKSTNSESKPKFLEDLSSLRIAFYLPATPIESKPDFTYGSNLQKPIFLNPLDPVTLYFKAATIVGVVVALPLILHQLWLFIVPGLKRNERKTLLTLLGLGMVLFPAGAVFAYFMFGMVLNFLLNFQIANMEPQLEVFKFVNLELRIMIGMGVVFELPLVVMFLTFLGILHPTQLRKYRPHVIVGLAIVSMAATPGTDPVSMIVMLVPLVILYELAILLSVPLAKRQAVEE